MNKLKYLSFGLAGLLVLAMMTATVLEKTCGTGFAVSQVYGSPFFVAGWGIMAGCSLVYLLRRRLFRQPFSFLMHLAFLIILAGALTTHLWSRQGNLHLRAGETPVRTYVGPDMRRACFPFHLRLDTFRIEYYPGTGAVMDFVSLVDFTDQNGKTETQDNKIPKPIQKKEKRPTLTSHASPNERRTFPKWLRLLHTLSTHSTLLLHAKRHPNPNVAEAPVPLLK